MSKFSAKQNIQVISGARKGHNGTILEKLRGNWFYVSVETGLGNRVKVVLKADELSLSNSNG